MTTHKSDFLRLKFVTTTANIPLIEVGLTWPPPERLYLEPKGVSPPLRAARDDDDPKFIMHRTTMSEIPDDVIARTSHVARGALYEYATE